MRLRHVAIAMLIPVGAVAGQGRPARPTIAIQLLAPDVAAGDSSRTLSALERGLQADSLVDFLHRPPTTASDGRAVEFMVATMVRRVGDVVTLETRTFNVQTSAIAVRTSTRAIAATLVDSATAVGRRIARAVAVTKH